MKTPAVRVLRGPNTWRRTPLLEIALESDFGFAQRWAATVVELQSAAWKPVAFVDVEPLPDGNQHRVLIGYEDEQLAQECIREAWLLHELPVDQRPGQMDVVSARLREFVARVCLHPSVWAIAEAARERGVPCQRLGRSDFLQLGYGSKRRLATRGKTDKCSHLGREIAGDKEQLEALLNTLGVPVAKSPETAEPRRRLYRLLLADKRLVAAYRNDGPSPSVDVTEHVHPQMVAQCVELMRALGLDVAELEVTDISPSWGEQSGGVTAVKPGWSEERISATPATLRRYGQAVVEHLFPKIDTGRIPVVAITGVNGKTTTTRLVAHLLKGLGLCVGMTCTDGVFIDSRCIDTDDCSGPKSARRVLANPLVEAAVCEVARGGILREGLGFDACDVAVVTNIADGDHLGLSWVKTPEDLARVKRVIVEAVAPHGLAVLKADDPLVAAMASHCPGRIVFFCCDAQHPVIVQHRASGGRALIERDGRIIIADGSQETVLMASAEIPLTRGGLLDFQVENVLAAVAAALGANVSLDIIRERLLTFDSDIATCPARFNVLAHKRATVILDYGHNPSAVAALVRSLERFPATKRHVVYSADGDRTDDQIRHQVMHLADAFDRVVLYEEPHRFRGRQPGLSSTLGS